MKLKEEFNTDEQQLIADIKRLKEEKDAVILAHYYVDGQVQALADYTGDSFFLSKKAKEVTQQNILFCGVSFMGESAKLLNPTRKVVMADEYADCPMAHMVDAETIAKVRKEHPDIAVICGKTGAAKKFCIS